MGGFRLEDAEFEHLYRTHYAFVRRLVSRLGVLPNATEDVTHDVFVALATSPPRTNPEVTDRAWLAGIARNVVKDHRRSTFRWIRNALGLAQTTRATSDGSEPENARAVTEVRAMLDRLPEEQRVVFILVEIEGWSAPELADGLGIPVNTVYSRLRAARATFDRHTHVLAARERRST